MKLIDKDALAAEIESKIEKYTKRGKESDAKRDGYGMYWGGVLSCLNEVRTLVDTLEVKEVDIENTAITKWNDYIKKIDGEPDYAYMLIKREDYIVLAKHFFELCMAVSSKARKGESKEPVGKVWHTTMEEPNGEDSIVIVYDNGCTVEPSFKDFKSYSEWGTIKQSYRVKLWAYLDVLLSLSTAERNGKNLKELKTMLNDSLSKETEDSLNEFLDKCESEDLEEAAQAWAYSEYHQNTDDDCDSLYSGFIKGANWQKQQMMKDAVALETEIYLEGGTTLQFKKGEIFLPDNKPKTSKFKAGDKVKLIIIKEE